jgi:hypothetical protein
LDGHGAKPGQFAGTSHQTFHWREPTTDLGKPRGCSPDGLNAIRRTRTAINTIHPHHRSNAVSTDVDATEASISIASRDACCASTTHHFGGSANNKLTTSRLETAQHRFSRGL